MGVKMKKRVKRKRLRLEKRIADGGGEYDEIVDQDGNALSIAEIWEAYQVMLQRRDGEIERMNQKFGTDNRQ